MDLYYTWISGNNYQITAVIFGDCTNISPGSVFSLLSTASPEICIFRGNINVATISLNIQSPTAGVDITPVCPGQVGNTQCENPGSTIPGIKKFVYTAIYTLPAPTVSSAWRFAFFGVLGNSSSAGRSVNITNIMNPGTSLMQLVDSLDNSFYPHNSNAQFSVIPTPFFCLNMPDSYNPGAVSPVGDSLSVINLIPAVDASGGGGGPCQFGVPVNYTGTAWNPPYTPISATTPLNVVAGSFSYDATTGQLNFNPNAIQRSTVVYNVREFRAGHFVGSCQREMNFLVQNCVSPPPTGGIAGASNGIIVDSAHMTTCANSGPFSFYFDPREPTTTNNITVTYSGLPAGATLNITGNSTPTPHIAFSWTTIGVAPGTYIFYLTYTDNNCPLQGTTTTAISVTILPSARVSYTVVSPIGCSPKEAINIIPSGQGSPWTIKVTGTTPQTFTGITGNFIDSLPPGTDTISIITSPAANRCDTAAYIVVPSPAIMGDTIVCAGSTLTLSDAITGGSWSSSNTSVATVVPTGTGMGTVTGVSAGMATMTYSFSGGCFKTVTVTVKPLPSAITGILHVCTGLTTTLSDAVSGGIWSSGTVAIATVGSVTGVVTGVTTGVAVISYSKNGCMVTASVTVYPEPSVIAGATNVCVGSTINLSDAIAGGTWSSSNTAAATIVQAGSGSGRVTGVAPGTTIITYILPGGCFRTTTVTVKPLPSAITGNMHACTGLTTILSDATSGGLWSSGTTAIATVGSVTGVVTGVTPGVVAISYTQNGCSVTTSVTVNIEPALSAGTANICTDGTATLTVTPGGGTWSISNTAVATIRPVGTDSLIVTGIHTNGTTVITYSLSGCTTSRTITAVSILPPITGPTRVCTGQSIILSNAITGGTWTTGNTSLATADAPTGTITGVSPGVPVITYSIGGSCTTTTTVTVNLSPNHGAITGLPNLCVGYTISLSDTVSGVWGMSNGSATISGGVVSGISPGIDTVRYIVSNTLCKDTATRVITVYAVPDSGTISGLNALCVGLTITLSDTAAGGVWSSAITGIATIAPAGGGVVTGVSSGIDTIEYTASNPGCSTVASYTVTVYDPPVPGIIRGGPVKVCAGAVFALSDTSGGVWSSSNTAVAAIDSITGIVSAVNQGVTTIYYTIGPNLGNCYGIATFTLTVTPQNTLTINSTVSQVTCNGDNNGSISVIMSGGTPPLHYVYLWSNGDTTYSITGLAPGYDTLHVTEPATLCKALDILQITQPDSLIITAVITQDKCKQSNGTIIPTVTGGTTPYQYHWSDNSTGTTLENLHAGTYSLTVTDHNDCVQTLSAEVTDNDCIINVHDVITPNGDGINDTWIIEGIDNYATSTVQVFDKWGDMVYEKTNYNNDWSGKGKGGNLLPDGTYFYVVKLNSINLLGGQNTFTGSILIKR
ncbi:MAG: gliding motility-associated C-terminal domain-containing protein [Chitinophagales bacterium]